MPAAVVILLLALPGQPTDADLLDEAGHAFAEGLERREAGERGAAAFRRSAERLEELRARGVVNATLLHDLGNAHFLAGDLPRAILTYRLGLRLSPGNRGLAEALDFARKQVAFPDGSGLGRPRDDSSPTWLLRLGGSAAFALAALAYLAACLCLTRACMIRGAKWRVAGVVLLLAAIAAGSVAVWRGRPKAALVVVARDGVALRKGDGESFPPWFDAGLSRGVEAALLHRRGDWLQVELAGGEVGWVRAADVVSE